MTTMPTCFGCKHLIKDDENMICDAFPNGIPEDILIGPETHYENVDGDNGIKFETD